MNRLPASFDRTSLVNGADRLLNPGPPSPWSPERRSRETVSPPPNPEEELAKSRRGRSGTTGAQLQGRDKAANASGNGSSRRLKSNLNNKSKQRHHASGYASGDACSNGRTRRTRIDYDTDDTSDSDGAGGGRLDNMRRRAKYDEHRRDDCDGVGSPKKNAPGAGAATSRASRRLLRNNAGASRRRHGEHQQSTTDDDADEELSCGGSRARGRLRSLVVVPAADERKPAEKDVRKDSREEAHRRRSTGGRHGGSGRQRSTTQSGSRQRHGRHHRHSSSSADKCSDIKRQQIKPRPFDGSGSFETFWAHFDNCATYNRWKEADMLAHLKAALIGDAGQVLWDSDASATNTLEKLTTLLRSRFSATRQSDKHRMELRLRRRRHGESLSALHQDIRRLMALAHPTLSQEARETIACDYYVDAMDDADFALKVRERAPATLDEALRIALQLEAWQRDARRSRNDDGNEARPKARGAAPASATESNYEAQFELLNRRIDELTRMVRAPAASTPLPSNTVTASQSNKEGAASPINGNGKGAYEQQPHTKKYGASTASRPSWPRRQHEARRPAGVCWTCGQPGHVQRNCMQAEPKTMREPPGAVTRGGRGLDRALVYLRMELAGKPHPCLLDSGCEVTLIPKALVEASKNIEMIPSKQRVWAANGSEIEVAGEACVPMWLDGRRIDTFALVSPDIEEIMLGADWLQAHNCLWDFGKGKLFINGRAAVPLSRKRPLCCRRIYLQEEAMLPPMQQVNVVARATLLSPHRLGADS